MGFDALYGESFPGRSVIRVPTALAHLFATAHELVFRRPAGVHLGGGTIDVAPEADSEWRTPGDQVVETLRAARAPLLVVGGGVVTAGAVPGLHALATGAQLGVINTWDAKGVFDWRSRHHLASAGLQELDLPLGGLDAADLVVTSGLEVELSPWTSPTVQVNPAQLSPLAELWSRPPTDIEMPPLRIGLAQVTQDGWAQTTVPMAPSQATRNYGSVIGRNGLLAADAGLSGYWIARTFATTALGTVALAVQPERAVAIACAAVAKLRQPERAVVAVIDGEPDEVVLEVLDAAHAAGAAVAVECWRSDGQRLPAEAHAERLHALVHVSEPTIVTLATDGHQLEAMVDAAGPIVAWPGHTMPRS